MPTTIRRILLCPNPTKDPDLIVTAQAAELFKGWGIELVLSQEVAGKGLDLPIGDLGETSADLAILFGGDGTILRHAVRAYGMPLLGVNLGRRGFMCALEKEELPLLSAISRGDYRVEPRMMMDVFVLRQGRKVFTATVLNDAVISKGGAARPVSLSVSADDHHLMAVIGDGMILSTPTGSTAYSMAAGGPILEPESAALLVTPVCAHAIFARPLVLAPERVLLVSGGSDGTGMGDAFLSADGGSSFDLWPGDRVVAQRSATVTNLVQIKPPFFYRQITEKIGGGRKE